MGANACVTQFWPMIGVPPHSPGAGSELAVTGSAAGAAAGSTPAGAAPLPTASPPSGSGATMGWAAASSGLGVGLGRMAAAKLGVCITGAGTGDPSGPLNTSKAPAPAAASTPPVTAAVTSVFLPGRPCFAPLGYLAVIDAIPSPVSEPALYFVANQQLAASNNNN